ncbi:MAG TPA: murein biosynthesis integral membrane protein MurJ [Deltaproteobacteria bacterium]|nr:murein biosynthesis integral membrane protein MurJ [Deltaproteobacteria bacterium]
MKTESVHTRMTVDSFKRNAVTVGGFTGVSRILGFVRDVVMAWLLGAGLLADAFIVAFRLPNLLRRFMAEGAVSVAFVPVFSEVRARQGIEKAFELSRSIFTLMFLLLVIVVIVGELIAPALVALIAPGFLNQPVFAEAVHLTRIMFPYILLIGIVSLCMGILNSLGHFAAPAASPILLNVFMISVPIIFHVLVPVFSSPADALAVGVILGGIAQLAIQIVPLRRRKVPLGFSRDLGNPRVRQVSRLMGISALGASVYQINVFVGTLLASLLATGSVSYLYYANRITELPLGIFAFAVGNVMLPAMSSASANMDLDKVSSLLKRAISAVSLFVIPASVGIFVLAEPIFAVLFMRGQFSASDVSASAYALQMYTLGLCAVGWSRIFTQALYAMQRAGLVVKVAWLTLGLNVILCLVLMPVMNHAGIALASSLSMFFQLVVLARSLTGNGVSAWSGHWRSFLKMTGAALVMGAFLLPFLRMEFWMEGFTVFSAGILIFCIIMGALLYFGLLRIMGIPVTWKGSPSG